MIRLQLTSGRGPAECRMALAHVLTRIAREADDLGLDVDVARGTDPDGYGPVSALVLINGDAAAELADRWTGTLLWIAKSEVRPHHRRKNWYIGCRRADPPTTTSVDLDPSDVRFEAFRAGGPGGQHQNKTESAVRAVHVPTGLAVVARDQRSQHRNKASALARLGELILAARNVSVAADRAQLQDGHDQLERGSPKRTFRGAAFDEA
ncbi:MAG: peptide chain release factor H [Pseudomonadota bacterium]